MMFLDCPAYLDQDGTVRCGLPTEVRYRFIMRSSDGPLESAMIRCPAGHWFSGPIGSLTWDSKNEHDPGTAGARSGAGHDSLQGFNDGRDGEGGLALRDLPSEPEPGISRPNTAPAYYLGRPARLWSPPRARAAGTAQAALRMPSPAASKALRDNRDARSSGMAARWQSRTQQKSRLRRAGDTERRKK